MACWVASLLISGRFRWSGPWRIASKRGMDWHGLVLQWLVCDEQPREFAGDRAGVAELEPSGARSNQGSLSATEIETSL